MRSWLYETTPTERKLFGVLQKRWMRLRRKPIIRIIQLRDDWEREITSLGMTFSKENGPWRPHEDKNHYVVDPASPLDEKYIVVPDELALKILVLGDLP